MGLCRFADMQSCAMRLGDGMVSGIYVFVAFTAMHLAEVVLFHTLCRLAGHWFYGFFHTLCHYAYGQFVHCWVSGSMDHGGSWECPRVLEISFVSSICFLGVCLVSGVFGSLDGDKYSSWSVLSQCCGERKLESSILHIHIYAHSVPFVIAFLFFPSLVLSLDTNRAVALIDHSIRIYLFDRSFDHRFFSIWSWSNIPPILYSIMIVSITTPSLVFPPGRSHLHPTVFRCPL